MSAEADLLQRIADGLRSEGALEIGTMFRRPGIRIGGRIVAFLGSDDELIVTLPIGRVRELVAAGDAHDVTMGARTMREWVTVAAADADDATLRRWLPLVQEALDFVAAQP